MGKTYKIGKLKKEKITNFKKKSVTNSCQKRLSSRSDNERPKKRPFEIRLEPMAFRGEKTYGEHALISKSYWDIRDPGSQKQKRRKIVLPMYLDLFKMKGIEQWKREK